MSSARQFFIFWLFSNNVLENEGIYLLGLYANDGISFQHLEIEPNKVCLVICPSLGGFGDVGQAHIGEIPTSQLYDFKYEPSYKLKDSFISKELRGKTYCIRAPV